MSIMNAIANCRTPFKEGSCRQVHYSKRYNLVIKKMLYSTNLDRQEIIYDDYQHQTAREREIFEKLTSEERHFFPIIDFVHSKKDNMIVTLMRKIDFVIGDTDYDNLDLLDGMDREEQIEMLNRLKEHFHLHFNVEFFIDTIIKYNIIDLHPFNIGVYNNHLVIIDFGYDIMD